MSTPKIVRRPNDKGLTKRATFSVSSDLMFNADARLLQALFKDMVPIHMEHRMDYQRLDITCYHPSFPDFEMKDRVEKLDLEVFKEAIIGGYAITEFIFFNEARDPIHRVKV